MTTVFSSGHGNKGARLSCMNRKCCEDNRTCPGSAAGGRRIQGSYCTLWNGLRNARCLTFLFLSFLSSESYHMWKATGFEDNVTPLLDACVARCWHTDVCGDPHSPTTGRRSHRRERYWAQTSSHTAEEDGKLVTRKNSLKFEPYSLSGRQLSTKNSDKFGEVSPSEGCSAADKIMSRNAAAQSSL